MAGKQHRHGADPDRDLDLDPDPDLDLDLDLDLDRDRDRDRGLDRDQFCCSVCLDLLKEPVTIPCGHSYCRRCIDGCWDQEEKEEKEPSCPQCRGTFSPRPLLKRSALLAEVVEKLEKSSTWRPSPPPPPLPLPPPAAWGAPEDDDVDEKMCERHGEPRGVYCRTDGKCICRLCVEDEHEGHDAVPVARHKAETQGRLVSSQKEVRAKVRQRRRELQLLSREEEHVTSCARTAMNDCDEIFAAMVDATRSRAADAKRLIALQQTAAAAQAGEMRLRLQEDVGRLMSRDAELERLLHADDHAMIQSVLTLRDSPNVAFNVAPLRSFRGVTECVSELRCKLEAVLEDAWPKVTTSVSYVDFSLPPAPTTRKELLRCKKLDGNSNYPYLHLIGDNLRVRPSPAPYSARPERFTKWPQVLCSEALSERCYWEVEGHARSLSAAVAYGDVPRTSAESQFGGDERSWCLEFTGTGFLFRHGGVETVVPGPGSKRVGVYLDYRAGTLSFYGVHPAVPLHTVRTTFTRPLHPGLGLNYEWYDTGVFAQLTKLWK